ncbi:MAG TPA: hypothetical protein PLC99_20505 [Verrucomicrobiota bacterium]|nr:hypothetical protein [Verrucomicrobiota bacterium]
MGGLQDAMLWIGGVTGLVGGIAGIVSWYYTREQFGMTAEQAKRDRDEEAIAHAMENYVMRARQAYFEAKQEGRSVGGAIDVPAPQSECEKKALHRLVDQGKAVFDSEGLAHIAIDLGDFRRGR